MADAALDNDVLLKGVSYGILDPLLAALPAGPYEHGILGTAKYVLPKALKKRSPERLDRALQELQASFTKLEILEPDEQEVQLAAQLEFEAQKQSLSLHSGECLLIAMLIRRELRHVLTGDRNAVSALHEARATMPFGDGNLAGRFVCFEQAMLHYAIHVGWSNVKVEICAERGVDTQMRICFSCSSPEATADSWEECLKSSIEDLRSRSGDLLVQ